MSTIWFGIGRQWRGFSFERTLFGPVVRCGWVSFGTSDRDLPDWIREWHSALSKAMERAKSPASNGKGQQR